LFIGFSGEPIRPFFKSQAVQILRIMYAETLVTNYLPTPLTSHESVKLKFAARPATQIFIPFPHFFPSSGQDQSHAPLSCLFKIHFILLTWICLTRGWYALHRPHRTL
jgi:hypothetical protein